MRAAIYARVSTFDQEPENQLQELRRYVEARGWTGSEFVDRGVSGAKDKRPALDTLLRDAKRRIGCCSRPPLLGPSISCLLDSAVLSEALSSIVGVFRSGVRWQLASFNSAERFTNTGFVFFGCVSATLRDCS